MATVTPAYFFDEFLLPVRRKAPTPRELALGFTVKDLDWLHTMYYATDAARQDLAVLRYPMLAERILLNQPGHAAVPLAGAFMLSPTPDDNKAVFYSPYGGLELFDSRADLLIEVQERLKQPEPRIDLLQFLSIGERQALPATAKLTLSTAVIPGAVMQDQQNVILECQQKNLVALLEELRKLPTLNNMLDTLLGIMARPSFPGLNPADTRVNFSRAAAPEDTRRVDSLPLRDALLRFYVSHAWPQDQTHSFSNIGRDTTHFNPQQLAEDQQRWDSVVEQTSGILSTLLNSLLQTYWEEDFNGGQSRRQLCAQVMSDRCRTDLLFKHQDRILSSDESQRLRALFLPDQSARTALAAPLNIEKVRVNAPFQHYVDLAGTLMISNDHAYLYTQSRGLQVLENLSDLKDALMAMLKAAGHEDELLNFLSLEERSVFIGMDQVEVTGKPVTGDVFDDIVDDILAKQFNNLKYALGLYRLSAGATDLGALLDNALDVRSMLDSRLLELDADGRWSVHPVTSANGRPSTVAAEKAKLHLQQLQTVETAMAQTRGQLPTLRDLAGRALDAELAKRRLDLTADEIYINTYATRAHDREEREPQASSSLVEHFIARLAKQAGALSESPLTRFYGRRNAGVANTVQNLTTTSVNALIERLLSTFAEQDLRTLPHLFLENNRAHLSHGMLLGLQGEVHLRRLNKSLPPTSLEVLESVLHADSLTRLDRHGLNGFIPDAFGLTLTLGVENEPYALANCFVLTERGGMDPGHSGNALLWTPRCGYEAFASIKVLREALEQRLQDPLERLALMENLPVSRRVPHQSWHLGPLQRIDEHLLHNRQQTYSDIVRDAIDHLFSMKLSARRFQDCMDSFIRQAPPTNLPRAMAIARAMIRQQALPVWLGMARPHEQIQHAELLEQYRISVADERDYLHGVTPMRDQVKSTLSTLLNARFPEQVVNPDHVLIPGRIDLEGHTQTLTDLALRHLPELRADTIRPRSRTATPLPATLDGDAVVQLIRQLDLKSLYQKKLAAVLTGETENTRQRRQLFCRQLPWQLLQYAHEQTLQERLSASAWSFIKQVLDMPDAVARAAVRGATAIVRPVELIATEGAALVKALGCYLIGPKAGASGPLILYAPYSPSHSLKEYADEGAFLNEFTTPGVLQDWITGQMDAPHQATYRHLLGQGWKQGHAEIRLGTSPVSGNLLTRLFQDNIKMLQQMLACQFSALGKARWEAVSNLLTQDIPNGLQFMGGKLAYPLVVWRSYKLFKASAEDLQQHRWQQALKTFAGGVAELASLRQELDKLWPSASSTEDHGTVEPSLQAPAPSATTLAELDPTDPARTQLQVFEDHDVALNELKQSQQSKLYSDASGTRHFVPLAGKVYPVKKAGEHWRMKLGEQVGPYVQRNAQGEWTLDLDQHHPHYGKVLSRHRGRSLTREGERAAINIEAVGIRKIAALSRWKAQCIDEALNVATYYAVTCKRNVLHFATHRNPYSRLGQFFGELFGVVTVTPDQVQRIERRVDEILDELTNHTLTGPDSMRFVSGTHRASPHSSFAFILPDDVEQKIYLLDRFFDPPMDIYQNRLSTPFDICAHARATVLIHEITHLKSQTEDLAYLDSMRPFPDLINVEIEGALKLKTDITNVRGKALSVLTPVSQLFKTENEFTRTWDDFGSSSETSSLKAKVLSTTGCRTLDQARSVFMSNVDKRIDTILANADSVTCMISHLGRVLDAGA